MAAAARRARHLHRSKTRAGFGPEQWLQTWASGPLMKLGDAVLRDSVGVEWIQGENCRKNLRRRAARQDHSASARLLGAGGYEGSGGVLVCQKGPVRLQVPIHFGKRLQVIELYDEHGGLNLGPPRAKPAEMRMGFDWTAPTNRRPTPANTCSIVPFRN